VWPGKIPAGKVNNSVMSVVDLVPTIAGLTKTSKSPGYVSDGKDESALLLGRKNGSDKEIYWYYNNKPLPGKKENISPTLAIRSGKWKLLMEADGSNKQLYNMEADHREAKNLVGQQKKVADQLTGRLSSWYAKYAPGT
jgi:arylsulfatase A-like enzyme